MVTAGNVDVEVDVDVDESAASLTFTACSSPKYLMGQLFASRRPDARNRVHVHDHVHVEVDPVRAFTARPIAPSPFPHTFSGLVPHDAVPEPHEVADQRKEGHGQGDPQEGLAEQRPDAELLADDEEADGNDLGEGLELAPPVGGDDDAPLLGDLAQAGDRKLPADDDDHHPGGSQAHFDQGDEGSRDEELVGDRVEERPGHGDATGAAGDQAVKEIGQGGDQEDPQTPEVAAVETRQQHHHEQWHQHDSQEGERVW